MKHTLSALLCALGTPLLAQDVAASLDYMDRLIVFDHGTFTQIEPLKPQAVGIGGNYVVYSDTRSDLKLYRDGKVTEIEGSSVVKPTVTNDLFGYAMAGALKVYDDKVHLLSTDVDGYVVEDSLVGYHDARNQTMNIFYHGQSEQVEDALAQDPVSSWKSGDNVIAWLGAIDKKLKVFHAGTTYTLNERVTDAEYKCGLDVVAYKDASDQSFKIFDHGEIHDIEPIMPTRYDMGMGMVAYLDPGGALKVYEDGKVFTAQDFTPDEFEVVDSLVIIKDQGFFKVFADHQLVEVERYIPKRWAASWGTIVYQDENNQVKVWNKGTSAVIIRGEPIRDFSIQRNLVLANTGVSTIKVWWRGKLYSY